MANDEALRAAGIDDPEAFRSRLDALWSVAVPAAVVDAAAGAADPALVLTALAHLRDGAAEALGRVGGDVAQAIRLVTLLGASPLVGRLLLAEVDLWPVVLTAGRDGLRTLVPAAASVGALEPEALWQVVRLLKRRRMLLIAARDLLGEATLEETTRGLSELAEDALEVAVAATRDRLVEAHGDVVTDAGPAGFVVLGMGKLGGGELNFSSDVDLVYLYADDARESAGGPRGVLTPHEFFARLAEGVTRALHHTTADGFVFRVDLRLRPEGGNGPIVNPRGAALEYYGAYGQTWERGAFLKARPVAGDRALGAAFLEDMEAFVYRRFLDYATVEDIAAMKARIEASLTRRPRGMNVKLGRGGIREIEFVIQGLQLVHAGKDARIRERNSLVALRRLAEHRYLEPADAAALATAYRFLRQVEHKIQLVDERQTQVVPAGADELRLARRLGYARTDPAHALERFREDCRRHTEIVHRAFAALLYSGRDSTAGTDTRFAHVLDRLEEEAETRTALAGLGFHEVEESRSHLRLLRDGPLRSPATPRRKKLLRKVAPALLDAVTRAPDPDLALRHLAAFLTAVGARSSFLALLTENPATLNVLVRLFGSSEFLSRLLVRHPEMLDNLVRADLVRVTMTKAEMQAELSGQIAAADDYEERLDVLRRFRHEHFLRVGINDLEGLLPFHEVSDQLSDLADVCVEAAWRVADEATRARYQVDASPADFVVVALGKHGGRELTYNSDLDVIFIYAPRSETAGTTTVHEYVTRLAQTMMTTLQVQTREGRMYLIDTRLRPSGNAGPLVSSRDAFARYHAESAQLWERQAMIKARVVAGDTSLADEVAAIVARFVYATPLAAEGAAEIHRIRMRMEHELAGSERAGFNIKTGRGGLVDIEFLVQMLQLRHGAAMPAVCERATRPALAALAAGGVLSLEEARALDASYAFLRALTNRLRIERDQAVEALDRSGHGLAAVARRLGYEGTNDAVARRLLDDYESHREAVRSIYGRWFGAAD
jgi:glutamate-ammonia-ligase adenylyltransferase